MSIFERSVTCSFFQELYSHIDSNSGEKVGGYVSRQNSEQGNLLKYIFGGEKAQDNAFQDSVEVQLNCKCNFTRSELERKMDLLI